VHFYAFLQSKFSNYKGFFEKIMKQLKEGKNLQKKEGVGGN